MGRIGDAAHRSGREPEAIRLVGVSKTVGVERLAAAVAAGLTTLGENRVQEASPKVAAFPDAEWHLVGQLQGNKAGRAIELFSLIQSVDSMSLAERLSRIADTRHVRILLQVNIDADPAKAGFSATDLDAHLGRLLELPGLRVDGLMTVGRLVERPEDARSTFVALRRLSESLQARHGALGGALSMGMSDDFEVAVEEGATIVRGGRALFGDRPTIA
ncbi:MAG: YggS family pyridoxal phosphate-dependent enzyme [Chloroflexi bacterium]|nr:YggS family pyridoxal phosphate-dependent enzyme [Chloroflexota bacterium]